jgi:CMP-N-acetylneuraminic acid synthetase
MRMKILALVTAKASSTRFAYKNKQVLYGKPLYKWTTDFIEMNRLSFFDSCVFSCDKPDSFNLDEGWLRLVREPYLIADATPHVYSVVHALHKAEKINQTTYDSVWLFQPTNPFRTTQMLYHAFALCQSNRSIQFKTRCLYMDHNMNRSYILNANFEGNTGDLSPFIKSGAIYTYSRLYLTNVHESEPKLTNMIVDKSQGYNINDEMDFKIVEAMMKYRGVPYGG